LFALGELAPLIIEADKDIFSMINKGLLSADTNLVTSNEKEKPLISILNIPQAYNAGRSMFLPPNTATINEKQLARVKKYLPLLYKHLPVSSKILFKKAENTKLIAYEMYVVRYDDTKFTASGHIKTAKGDMDYTGRPVVTIQLDNVGTNIWSRMTTKNTGRYIAIIVNDELLSAPRVDSPIEGGNTQISGVFTIQEAEKMAASLSGGYLPVKLEFVSMKEILQK
jgi:SecD/SecF fusion protein